MNENINLLLHADKGVAERNKTIKIINIIAAASLISVCMISAIIFIMIKVVNPEAIVKQQADVIMKISKLQDKEAKYYIASSRIGQIEKIIKIRKDIPKIAGQLLAKVPEGLSINIFEINKDSIVISGQSKSLLTIGEFIDNLTDMVHRKEIIKSLTLSSLDRDEGKDFYGVSVKSEL
jgi:hypothetical protein